MQEELAVIVLAAGASSRLGKPKQNLLFKQTTLLQYSIDTALESKAGSVLVILGAKADAIQIAQHNPELHCLINDQWAEGMASSIRCGITHLVNYHPSVTSVVLMACDQPYINTALLNKLVTLQQETSAAIVASRYGNTKGIPAIFSRQLFPELLQLTGDTGAKKIIAKYTGNLETVDFPLGLIDIDTPDDYKSIQNNERK